MSSLRRAVQPVLTSVLTSQTTISGRPVALAHAHQNSLALSAISLCGHHVCWVHSSTNPKTTAATAAVPSATQLPRLQDEVTNTSDDVSTRASKAVNNADRLTHFRDRMKEPIKADGSDSDLPPMGVYALPHPIWDDDQAQKVTITHRKPERLADRLAIGMMNLMRVPFDAVSGYNKEPRSEQMWVNRICFLETLAGVPGMVAAMVRHLNSLRWMRRDHGWIHTLLEEAENERMHLMTALQLKQPTFWFRAGVVGTQGVFVTGFTLAYLISPRFCHRFVGYLEEEAVATYTKLIGDMAEGGSMYHWTYKPAPQVAIDYWQLPETATMKDVIYMIRADEAHHRGVNHSMASMKKDQFNPHKPGQ